MFREEYETERLTLMLPSMSLAVQITEFEIRNREFLIMLLQSVMINIIP